MKFENFTERIKEMMKMPTICRAHYIDGKTAHSTCVRLAN